MSHSLAALQENALRAADAFCQRYIPPPKKMRRRVLLPKQSSSEKKKPKVESPSLNNDPDTPYRKKCRITWAVLIKAVFEFGPLKCPQCGGTMKIISFIEEDDVIRKS